MIVFVCILANLLIDIIVQKAGIIYVKISQEMPIDAIIRPTFLNRDMVGN